MIPISIQQQIMLQQSAWIIFLKNSIRLDQRLEKCRLPTQNGENQLIENRRNKLLKTSCSPGFTNYVQQNCIHYYYKYYFVQACILYFISFHSFYIMKSTNDRLKLWNLQMSGILLRSYLPTITFVCDGSDTNTITILSIN